MKYWKFTKNIISSAIQDSQLVWQFGFSLVILIVGISLSLLVPLLLKKILDSFATIPSSSLVLILISYGLIWTLSQVSTELRSFLSCKIEQRITLILGHQVLTYLVKSSHGYFIDQKPGALMNIMRRAQRDIPSLTLGIFFHIIPTFLKFLGVIFLTDRLYPTSWNLLLAGTILLFLIYSVFSIKVIENDRLFANTIDQDVDGSIADWLSNHTTIKAFGQTEATLAHCEMAFKKREAAEVQFLKKFSIIRLVQLLILGVGLTYFTYVTGQAVIDEELSIGDFVLLNGFMLQFITPISILGHVFQDVKKAIIDMKGIVDFLLIENAIKEVQNPLPLKDEHITIEFKNVSFAYNDKKVLNNLSFRGEPGENILILGPSGSGKSTLAKLLLRLYDPTKGQVLLNQIDFKYLSFNTINEFIGWVPQETYLLNDTIKNNLLFIDPDATQSDIEIALHRANILDFIMSLPEKFDTHVGDKGLKLSGGQKQRISLARLFLKQPKICIFDEATSFLDRETERIIEQNITNHLSDMTKIIITHRPFMLKEADKVIHLNENHSGLINTVDMTTLKQYSSLQVWQSKE